MGPSFTFIAVGIRVRCAVLTPIVLAFVVGGLAMRRDTGDGPPWVIALVTFAVVALLILSHEAARVIAYRQAGVRVRGIDLTIVGASPSLVDPTDSPRRETIAGLAGLVAATGFALVAFEVEHLTRASARLNEGVELVMAFAVAIVLVQLLPALPLDGGRIFRGLVWYLSDDPVKGSRGAAIYGHFISALLIGGGAVMLVSSGGYPFWGLGAVFAGLQLVSVSARSVRDSIWQQAGRALTLAAAELPYPRKIAPSATVEEAVDALIAEGDGAVLLVVDAGEPVGVLRLRELRRTRRAEWSETRVESIMTPARALTRFDPATPVVDAVLTLDRSRSGVALTQDERGVHVVVQRDLLLNQLVARAYLDRTVPKPD